MPTGSHYCLHVDINGYMYPLCLHLYTQPTSSWTARSAYPVQRTRTMPPLNDPTVSPSAVVPGATRTPSNGPRVAGERESAGAARRPTIELSRRRSRSAGVIC